MEMRRLAQGVGVLIAVAAALAAPDAQARGWVLQPAANSSLLDGLAAVDCSGARACMAVGSGSASGSIGAESWDGKRWRAGGLPTPPQATASELSGVSCVGPAACEAVGSRTPARFTGAPWPRSPSAGTAGGGRFRASRRRDRWRTCRPSPARQPMPAWRSAAGGPTMSTRPSWPSAGTGGGGRRCGCAPRRARADRAIAGQVAIEGTIACRELGGAEGLPAQRIAASVADGVQADVRQRQARLAERRLDLGEANAAHRLAGGVERRDLGVGAGQGVEVDRILGRRGEREEGVGRQGRRVPGRRGADRLHQLQQDGAGVGRIADRVDGDRRAAVAAARESGLGAWRVRAGPVVAAHAGRKRPRAERLARTR